MKPCVILLTLVVAPALLADEPPRDLKKIEAAIKESPDDPMLHYKKCQALFADGKEQEAIEHAAVAMEKFQLAKKDLAWMGLGFIKTKRYRIEVRYNMGPKERSRNRSGIVRPYSFHVWTLGDTPRRIQKLDFELGYFNGKAMTAAVGEMTRDGHANYGIVDPKSKFASVKKKVLEVLAER